MDAETVIAVGSRSGAAVLLLLAAAIGATVGAVIARSARRRGRRPLLLAVLVLVPAALLTFGVGMVAVRGFYDVRVTSERVTIAGLLPGRTRHVETATVRVALEPGHRGSWRLILSGPGWRAESAQTTRVRADAAAAAIRAAAM